MHLFLPAALGSVTFLLAFLGFSVVFIRMIERRYACETPEAVAEAHGEHGAGIPQGVPVVVSDLSKIYGNVLALEHVSFSVGHQEAVGLLGPNGAGKSTLLRILAGQVAPTFGVAKVFGLDCQYEARTVRRIAGYVSEETGSGSRMSVAAYLDYRARKTGLAKAEREARVSKWIELCHLAPVQGKRTKDLSRGYRRRLTFAEALLLEPQILFLDEPMGALDPISRRDLQDFIKSLNAEGKTIVLATHVLSDVESICARVVLLSDGRIRYDGRVQDIQQSVKEEFSYLARNAG